MTQQSPGEHLIIEPNTLVFYIDDTGDERLSHQQHPVFAFGGVAAGTEFHIPIGQAWRAMKAKTFPQVAGPLHAKTHLRDRLTDRRRLAVLKAMDHQQLGRFGTIITAGTVVAPDKIIAVACLTLANRLASVAEGMANLGLWKPPGRVVAVFEHSARLTEHLQQHLGGLAIKVYGRDTPLEGCFMPKSVADPFLEMADFVASTLGKNVKYQLEQGRQGCTDNFHALFRAVGPPLADYIEVSAAA
ncbi:MAG TPA: DUF3800 domain-containing protein [Stellaceae bacterium]|nr:DUF3800 domain-containing protein [Stellaceae bacterium]